MKIKWIHRLVPLLGLCFWLVCSGQTAIAEMSPPMEGGRLPEIVLQAPTDADQQKILGLPSQPTFTIPQIGASVVLIEIYSMYCPHCQKQAPRVNELYQKILKSPKLKDQVRLIGIGAGNSKFEVAFFRKTYSVLFPLFSDGDFTIHKQLGEVRTPYFIGIKINPDKSHKIFYSRLGAIENPDQFLEMVAKQLN